MKSCSKNCLGKNVIDDFINNIVFELRVIQEQMDYLKYNEKPTRFVD